MSPGFEWAGLQSRRKHNNRDAAWATEGMLNTGTDLPEAVLGAWFYCARRTTYPEICHPT